MPYLEVALASFWQLARHPQQGEAEELKMSCEARSINIRLNDKLGHPDLLPFHHPSAPSYKRKSPSQLLLVLGRLLGQWLFTHKNL